MCVSERERHTLCLCVVGLKPRAFRSDYPILSGDITLGDLFLPAGGSRNVALLSLSNSVMLTTPEVVM